MTRPSRVSRDGFFFVYLCLMTAVEYSVALQQTCIQLFVSNMPDFFAPSELADYGDFLDKLVQGGDRSEGALYYYVGMVNDSPCACGGIGVSPDGLNARMVWGMVRRDRHRKGIGREFLGFRIKRIRELFPYASISLDTTQHSFGFFEKHGFEVTKVTPDYYAPAMDRYDMSLRSDDLTL